jgi:hypothetical protein
MNYIAIAIIIVLVIAIAVVVVSNPKRRTQRPALAKQLDLTKVHPLSREFYVGLLDVFEKAIKPAFALIDKRLATLKKLEQETGATQFLLSLAQNATEGKEEFVRAAVRAFTESTVWGAMSLAEQALQLATNRVIAIALTAYRQTAALLEQTKSPLFAVPAFAMYHPEIMRLIATLPPGRDDKELLALTQEKIEAMVIIYAYVVRLKAALAE